MKKFKVGQTVQVVNYPTWAAGRDDIIGLVGKVIDVDPTYVDVKVDEPVYGMDTMLFNYSEVEVINA